jgi:uncharacterized protein (DUF4415 family)
VSFSAEELRRLPPASDWAAVDALTEKDIARAIGEDSDVAPLDIDWSKARLRIPAPTVAISLRVAPDVLAFFKAKGKGYQTRMNAVLRAYAEHARAKKRRRRVAGTVAGRSGE